jgi:hypothetical protein
MRTLSWTDWAGWIALGLVFVWLSFPFRCLDVWESTHLAARLLGLVNLVVVAVTIVATYVCINDARMRAHDCAESTRHAKRQTGL